MPNYIKAKKPVTSPAALKPSTVYPGQENMEMCAQCMIMEMK